jgi:hypothetical protein
VADAGFCHGAAGVAHIFNHLHQATGEERFGDAARDWIERVYAHRAEGEGVAGFRAWNPDPNAASKWLVEPGLLAGAAGVGAVLAAACTSLPPRWDGMFLLDGSANG